MEAYAEFEMKPRDLFMRGNPLINSCPQHVFSLVMLKWSFQFQKLAFLFLF